MRASSLLLMVFLSSAASGLAFGATAGDGFRELALAEAAYNSNVAIGKAVAGKLATMEQVSDAESFYLEAIAKARRVIAMDPGLAEGHHLLGLILCNGYRALQAEEEQSGPTEANRPRTVYFLLPGGEGCEEGLKELRAGMDLAKARYGYQVDYAAALLTCGQTEAAEKQAQATWKLSLSSAERASCARVLADCAKASNRREEEIRWLREIVKHDPADAAASQRLAKLAPSAPTREKPKNAIAWVEYEAGLEAAGTQKKPVMIDFTASWCGWSRKLEKEVFPDRRVIALSREFVCIKVDGDERPELMSKYDVDGYPTLVFPEHDGTELNRMSGYAPVEEVMAEMKSALAAREAASQ